MSKVYLFTSKTCVECPVVKASLKESGIKFIEIDIYSTKYDDMQFDLLSNNIHFMTIPRIIVEDAGKMRMVEIEEIV